MTPFLFHLFIPFEGIGFLFNLLFKKCLKSELTKRFKSFLKDAARYLNVHFRYIMKPPE